MNRDEWLQTLSKDQLITMLKNTQYQLELAEDKVEYFTGCRAFGESDGMNGSCVECSYECHALWEKCHPFNTIFWPWHCDRANQRKEYEETKEYKIEFF